MLKMAKKVAKIIRSCKKLQNFGKLAENLHLTLVGCNVVVDVSSFV